METNTFHLKTTNDIGGIFKTTKLKIFKFENIYFTCLNLKPTQSKKTYSSKI